MTSHPALSPDLLETTDLLVRNLLASQPFARYHQAHSALDRDPIARSLLDQLAQTHASVRKRQADGGVTEADLATLRDLQGRVQSNPIIVEYVTSQQEAVKFLREVNQEIGQLLGVNFASLANRATC